MTHFQEIRRRMPHFFDNVSVLEYVPHDKCKKIEHLFSDSYYVVLNPKTNDLSEVQQDSFRVAMSVDYFHLTRNYLEEFVAMHRVASKFVMFSCSASGKPIKNNSQLNLTEADFYCSLDLDSMFETHSFYVDYLNSDLYFWGVKA